MKLYYQILVLTLIIGASVNACFSMLFTANVQWTLFPWISLILSARLFHLSAFKVPLKDRSLLQLVAVFMLGMVGYSVLLRVEYPNLGNNFLPSLICLALMVYLVVSLGWHKAKQDPKA